MSYADCCEPLHRGDRPAATAEMLMRSRFSAYAVGHGEYLRATWDRTTLPADFVIDPETEWRRLHIVDTELGGADDDTGIVEFVARYRHNGKSGSMRERSEFVRDDGCWRYVRGSIGQDEFLV